MRAHLLDKILGKRRKKYHLAHLFALPSKKGSSISSWAFVTIAKFSAFPSIFSNLNSFYTCSLIPSRLNVCKLSPLCCVYWSRMVRDLCVVWMPILGHHLDNLIKPRHSTSSRRSRSTLPSAWYDVTESRSGKGNSPDSVNMYLGHAAGQLNVTKELCCYQKALFLLLTTTIVFSIIIECHLTVNFSFIS